MRRLYTGGLTFHRRVLARDRGCHTPLLPSCARRKPMEIICTPARARLPEGQGLDLDVLVRLRAPTQTQESRRVPVCVVPIVDVSGSMKGPKLAAVQHAVRKLVENLVPGDHCGVVVFDSEARTLMPIVEVTEARKVDLMNAIGQLRAGDNTNLTAGVLEAVAAAARARVQTGFPSAMGIRGIVLTDGIDNWGEQLEPEDLGRRCRDHLTLSCFGYGSDCDHMLLSALADAAGGSYAFIENDDLVLTAFGRELGGLVATCARAVEVRCVPGAGAPMRAELGDLLFGSEVSTVFRLAIAPHVPARAAEIASIEARWRDDLGRERTTDAPVEVSFCAAGDADASDRPDVARAADERRLREAQIRAEKSASKGHFSGAVAVLSEAIAQLRDPALISFAKEILLQAYVDGSAYASSSTVRSTSATALRRKKRLLASAAVEDVFGPSATARELEMEKEFKK